MQRSRITICLALFSLAAADVRAQQATWDIDPGHSHVGFRVRHLMIATIRGRFETLSGTIRIDPRDTTRSSVEVEIASRSVASGNSRRDNEVRGEDFLAVARHPAITFRSTRIERGPGGWRATGNLTIRGVSRPVTIPFTLAVSPDGERMGVSASLAINREDFGMRAVPAATVGREITIDLDVEAARVGIPEAP